jgi:glycosyltransferase involved in cell wall biosynthesis
MVRNRDIIIVGIQPWDIEIIQNNLWNLYPKTILESINWISYHPFYNILNKRNSELFANNIKTAIQRLGFKDYVLFNDSSMFLGLHLKTTLKPLLYAYYVRDNLVKVPYWRKHGARLEPELIKTADLVLNNSEYYTDYSSEFNNNSVMVGQGCDVSMFNVLENEINPAEDFEDIPSPIIGYVGSLTTLRLDIELLEFIANKKQDWSIVLVGPEDDSFKKSNLHQLSNVFFLGNKLTDELPSYIKGFDVAINPQIINELTIGNYPRKIDEYLAMGKPIVATSTKAMEMFSNHVYLGETKEDYIKLIDQSLKEHNELKATQRIKFANTHTWVNSVDNIYRAMDNTLKQISK